MIREALSHLHWSVLPVVSMFSFLGVFVGILFWSFRKGSTGVYETASRLPLEQREEGSLR
jgi:cbb3-type cytochrome oxidase subunit 3